MKVLGIEASCDETAVAIVNDQKQILSHALNSQIQLHQKYGGVIPELAARSHLEVIDQLVLEALRLADSKLEDLDGIAVTAGPGLIGGLIVGLITAKTIASVAKKPLIALNHLEAHALTVRLTDNIGFPYLLLLVSGGHTQILMVKGVGNYAKLGETIDDALGEAFDKVASMLGFGYPGGPEVERAAKSGNPKRFNFPKPLFGKPEHKCNFSFSGLKTSVRRVIEQVTGDRFSHFASAQKLGEQDKFDICASFQKVVTAILINRLNNALMQLSEKPNNLVIAGGVAANRYIFDHLNTWAISQKLILTVPRAELCTDNAAMVAWAGIERLRLGHTDTLDFEPRSRWSLC